MHKIYFTKQSLKTLRKIPRKTTLLIREKLAQIAIDPYATHHNVTKLQNRPGFRLRVGDYRVLYEVKNDQLIILVLKIAPRGEVYR
ncbi:MAG: type II toxin-antitoxin system RelE/ParE family toxin [Anaerolineae bacterium]